MRRCASTHARGALVRLSTPVGPRPPVLQLVHPIASTQDRQMTLVPHPDGWRATQPVAAGHGWQLRLQAADGRWRLVGRYQPGDTLVRLAPSLPAP